jgi:hypothetical protein
MQMRQPAHTRRFSPFKAQAPVWTTRWPRWNGGWPTRSFASILSVTRQHERLKL